MKSGTPSFPKLAAAAAIALTIATITMAQQKKADVGGEPAYYTPATAPIFNPYPNVTDRGPWLVRNLGPVGIGIQLTRPGMTMLIHNVEKGSPAEVEESPCRGGIVRGPDPGLPFSSLPGRDG